MRVLRDEQLLSALSGLVKTGNALNTDVLAHLAELDERRLYLELGFSSLFAYCVESLGMDESATGRRITAARVCRRFPGTFSRVANGSLGLSVLCALNSHLTPDNAAELFNVCSNKTRRRVDELLAARFPKPDVRDSIRRVPNQAEIAHVPGAAVASLTSASSSQSPNPNSSPSAPPVASKPRAEPPQKRIEPLSAERYGFHFTGSAGFKEKLEHARALLSHELPSGEMAAVFELALDALLRDREKRRFALGRKPRRSSRAHSPGERAAEPASDASEKSGAEQPQPLKQERSRHIPAAIAREVYERDGGRCCFVSKDGRRCNSRVFLQIDHIQPFAAGGAAAAENLRLRCRAHNQLHALRYFGRERISAARLARRSTKAQADHDGAARGTV